MEIIDVSTAGDVSAGMLSRPVIDIRSLEQRVEAILSTVQKEGDRAVREFSQKFDQVAPETFELSAEEINAGAGRVGKELGAAIRAAHANILNFHQRQQQAEKVVEVMPGVKCWRKSVAIEKVGL